MSASYTLIGAILVLGGSGYLHAGCDITPFPALGTPVWNRGVSIAGQTVCWRP